MQRGWSWVRVGVTMVLGVGVLVACSDDTATPGAGATPPGCGDGEVSDTEGCDDGNVSSGDGCSNACQIEAGWACASEQPSACTFFGSREGLECGNGEVSGDEDCDDGNRIAGDGCDGACAVEGGWTCQGEPSVCQGCGDGQVLGDEECDDGAANSDSEPDACRTTCARAACGDGVIDDGEQCDDGGINSDSEPGACRTDCQLPTCGDGVTDPHEDCDNGELNSDTEADACRTDCRFAGCGDGVVDVGELCDEGVANSDVTPDACRTTCTPPSCGDWVLDLGEQCDRGTNNSDTEPGACRSGCLLPWCGDGVTDQGEQCDSGGANSDTEPDACRVGCTFPACGDGVVDAGELCDEGEANSDTTPNACRTLCVPPSCGDGVVDGAEGCDDGGDVALDGCAPGCTVESGWVCSGSPSLCGVDCQDDDGDLYGLGAGCLGPDCDDSDPAVNGGAVEICNGIDDNCDLAIDDVAPVACYTGATGTSGTGPCTDGVSSCTNGVFGPCVGEVVPRAEICGDVVDNDCDGTADQTSVCVGGLGTYVSALTGDDGNDGTQQSPVATIAQGIANAVTIGGVRAVRVAEGRYPEKITLTEGVSLLGGYHCDATECTWERDPMLFGSVIRNTDRQGVVAGVEVTSVTVFEGFTVEGRDTDGGGSWRTPGTAAITVSGGTPVIRGNTIYAGDEWSCSDWDECGSFGVRLVGPTNDPVEGVRVEGNAIYGGRSEGSSCAALALVRNPAPIASVVGNWIQGGTCRHSRAVDAWSSGYGTSFEHNEIFAGTSNRSGGSSFAMILSGYCRLDGNMINHDQSEVGVCTNPNSEFWCGGVEAEGATATITNNVIFGMPSPRSVALFMGDGEVPFGLITVSGNVLDGGGVVGSSPSLRTAALACRTNQGTNARVGRITNNILLGGRGRTRFGMYEMDQDDGRTCEPSTYDNNDVTFAAQLGTIDNAHRRWTSGRGEVLLPTVAEVNLEVYANDNFSADPLLDPTFHLGAGSPCIDAGVSTDAPPNDIDGEARPQGLAVDVGADEAG